MAVCHRSWRNRGGVLACAMWCRSWRHATDHVETVKVTQLRDGGAAGAVPAVVDVPVIMQRRWVSRRWKFLRFISRQSQWTFQVAAETGTLYAWVWRR